MKDVDRMGNTLPLSWLNMKTGGRMDQRSLAEKALEGRQCQGKQSDQERMDGPGQPDLTLMV